MAIHKIKKKALVITLFILMGFLVTGIDSHPFSQSACACLSINEATMHFLNKLNSDLQGYAKQHSGRFPSYAEFRIISAKILPELNGQPYPVLSPVNLEQHCFVFTPGKRNIHKIGYALAPDQKKLYFDRGGENRDLSICPAVRSQAVCMANRRCISGSSAGRSFAA